MADRDAGVDLNDLSPAALSAAMKGGTAEWGQRASAAEHARYIQAAPSKSRRRCWCGCKRRATHLGMANGISLTMGCELLMRRWVKDPMSIYRKKAADQDAASALRARALGGG